MHLPLINVTSLFVTWVWSQEIFNHDSGINELKAKDLEPVGEKSTEKSHRIQRTHRIVRHLPDTHWQCLTYCDQHRVEACLVGWQTCSTHTGSNNDQLTSKSAQLVIWFSLQDICSN